jgi:PAS domain S-box-containing protein
MACYELLAGTALPSLGLPICRAVAIVLGCTGGGISAFLFAYRYRQIYKLGVATLAEKAELAEAVRLHDRAMAASGSGIVIADARKPDFPIIYANPAFERLTGYSADEVLGSNCRLLQGTDRNQDELPRLRDAMRSGEPVTVLLRNFRKDGTLFWNEFSVSPIHNSEGVITHYVGIQNDVTAAVESRSLLALAKEDLESKVAERTAALQESHTELRHQYDRLQGLQMIDLAIRSSLDVDLTLNIVATQAQTLLGADAVGCLVLTRAGDQLRYAAAGGYRAAGVNRSRIPISTRPACSVLREHRSVQIADITETMGADDLPETWQGEDFKAFMGIPLIAKGKTCGLIEILSRSTPDWDHEWVQLADDLAGRATVALDNATLFGDLQEANDELVRAYDATLEGWVKALDIRDHETEGHTQRVTETTVRLAEYLGIPASDLPHIRRGALLHDIGKIGIPDAILLKPGALTDEERKVMQMHTMYAYRWLSPIPYLARAMEIPYAHHERWDGTGYPRGLMAEEIPLSARIFMVVDVWDALRSTRPYRVGQPEEEVWEHILSRCGNHFEPRIAEAFVEMRRKDLETECSADWAA